MAGQDAFDAAEAALAELQRCLSLGAPPVSTARMASLAEACTRTAELLQEQAGAAATGAGDGARARRPSASRLVAQMRGHADLSQHSRLTTRRRGSFSQVGGPASGAAGDGDEPQMTAEEFHAAFNAEAEHSVSPPSLSPPDASYGRRRIKSDSSIRKLSPSEPRVRGRALAPLPRSPAARSHHHSSERAAEAGPFAAPAPAASGQVEGWYSAIR
jgi:hypothetical protein